MSRIFSAIRSNIYSAANSAGGFLRIILGTPGNQIEYPTDDPVSQFKKTQDTGKLWDEDAAFLHTVLNEVGLYLDRCFIMWARVSTNATGVSPTVGTGRYINSAHKNETFNTLQLNFAYAFNSANDYIIMANPENSGGYTPVIATRNASYVRFTLQNGASTLAINNKTINALVIGYQNP